MKGKKKNEHRTLNIEHPTSNIEGRRLRPLGEFGAEAAVRLASVEQGTGREGRAWPSGRP